MQTSSAIKRSISSFPFFMLFIAAVSCSDHSKINYDGWPMVGGNETGNKYSTLSNIDTGNVHQLQVAWTYNTGDADTSAHSQIQCNPIVVNGILFGTSPQLKLFALDAATGRELWVYSPFDSIKGNKKGHFNLNNNRGVTYWTDGKEDHRIFYVAGPYLHSIDITTGKLSEGFGTGGKIDLHDGLGGDYSDLFVTHTSAPSVYKDLVLTGTRVSEGMDAAPGHIRAYNARTGKQVWIFHTIPKPGEAGHETWEDPDAWKYTGGGNNWMGMTIDQQRGIAFVPTGSAAMDFYGGKRRGSNLYTDCLLALDAATGKRIWHFQYIHHDTWDWDPSSYPVLTTIKHNGESIDVVTQTTKTGFVFVFNRETGESIFPIDEMPVDTMTTLINERLWPTQPVPRKPAPFVRQSFTEKDINPHLSKDSYEKVRARLAKVRTGRMFTPQSKEGTIIFPGFDGGAEWGGPAVDPVTNILYVNANEMPWILEMLDVSNASKKSENYQQAGMRLYKQHCMSCHGDDRKGGGNNPSLLEAGANYDGRSFIEFINTGRRMMPAFNHLSIEEKEAIGAFVLNQKNEFNRPYFKTLSEAEKFRLLPYNISGYNKFLSSEGYPAIAPPWGSLTAIDLNSGELVWKTVLGEDSLFKAKGVQETGTENYGGPVVTKGGLLFIAATKDKKFRAYNKSTGKLLWETILPAAGFATPSTFEKNGRQFVVIACGGGKLGTSSGDSYVAFAIPD